MNSRALRPSAAMRLVHLAVPLLVCWPCAASGQVNDDSATPTVIDSWRFTDVQDISSATTQVSDPIHSCWSGGTNYQDDKSVWYSFTPVHDGTAFVDLTGTDFYAVVGFYTGSPGSLAGVELDGAPRSVGASCRFFGLTRWQEPIPVTAGTQYLIEVTRFHGNANGHQLALHFHFLRPLSWQLHLAPVGISEFEKILIAPGDDNTWYVGSDNGVAITRDGGATWERHLAGYTRTLAIDPTNPNRIFAGSGNVLYRYDNQGRFWCRVNVFPTGPSIYSILASPIDAALFVGMYWGNHPDGNGLYKSTDGGKTWTLHAFDIPPIPYDQHKGLIIWDIAEDPVNGYLYLATEPAQKPPCMPGCYDPPFLRSQDRGVSWQDISGPQGSTTSLGAQGVRIQVNPVTQAVYVQLEDRAVRVSSTFGPPWAVRYYTHGWDLLMDPAEPTTFVAGGLDGIIRLSLDDAVRFTEIGPSGLSGITQFRLALNTGGTKLYASSLSQPTGVYVADLSLNSPVPPSPSTTPSIAAEGASSIASCVGNFAGKISLVQTTSAGTRFFIRAQSLSLFATGDYRDVLLEAFFHKSSVSVGYTAIPCPGGITGTCGNVTFASVDVSNLTP